MRSRFVFVFSFLFISNKLTRSQIFETPQIHQAHSHSDYVLSNTVTRDEANIFSRKQLLVSLSSAIYPGRPTGIKTLYLCQNCSVPEKDTKAVHLDGLIASKGPQNFNLKSVPAVYAVPNHGEGGDSRIMNSESMYNSIAVFDRGAGVTIVEKILTAQEFGAVGVIIIDDGSCDEAMRRCSAQTGTITKGFATMDHWSTWSQVQIPCILITQKRGEKLRKLMGVIRTDVHGVGKQYIDSQTLYGILDEESKDEL